MKYTNNNITYKVNGIIRLCRIYSEASKLDFWNHKSFMIFSTLKN